ncbi:uncharacterized protein JCM10292_003036 [Rhodotorula paludigena]|uniref:uncharacterized protein n=1 Tax=Rhodotorula paludigena TaxID=86838 RepID=UPI003177D8CF
MSEQDNLPPLPPPLPHTHSRSLSSSSSSDAGSPRPNQGGWGGGRALTRTDSAASTSSTSTTASEQGRRRNAARSDGALPSASQTYAGSRRSPPGKAAPTLERTLSAASSSASSRARTALSAAAIYAADLDFPRSSSRTSTASPPASSAFLARPSYHSPTASSFHTHSLGLRGSPGSNASSPSFPAPSAFFAPRPHTSHAQQLPSPPRTASESGSAGTRRSATVPPPQQQAQLSDEHLELAASSPPLLHSHIGSPDVGSNGGSAAGASPNKPLRPPKSEARRWGSVSAASGQESPVTAGDASPRVEEEEHRYDDDEGIALEPRSRRVRARTSDAEAGEGLGLGRDLGTPSSSSSSSLSAAFDGDEAERRRAQRAKRAEELRGKNQRILDAINGSAAAGPGGMRRSSTNSTIRDLAETTTGTSTEDGSIANEDGPSGGEGGAGGGTWLEDNAREPYREFGAFSRDDAQLPIPRSRTLGDLDRARPVTTYGGAGVRSLSSRAPLSSLRSGSPPLSASAASTRRRFPTDLDDAPPLRATTSMSFYPPSASSPSNAAPRSATRATPRRSDLLLASRSERAATAFGGTTDRDEAIAQRLRASGSREVLSGASSERRRVQSESSPANEAPPTPTGTGSLRRRSQWGTVAATPSPGSGGSSTRERLPLPLDFRAPPPQRPSTSDALARALDGLDLDDVEDGSADLSPSRSTRAQTQQRPVTSMAMRHQRAGTASPTLGSGARSGAGPRRPASSMALASLSSAMTPARGGARPYSRAGAERDEDEGDDELETTPKSGRKRGSKESGGAGAERQRTYSRISGERMSEARTNGFLANDHTPPPPSARSDDRFSSVSGDTPVRRSRGPAIDPEAFLAEVEDIRRRTLRSRASGSSGDAASSIVGARSQTDRDRDRTLRAINALLAGQGIVATAAGSTDEPLSPAVSSDTSSPRKRLPLDSSTNSSARSRRISFLPGTNADAPTAPGLGSSGMSRSNSATSSATPGRAGAESVLKGLIKQAGSGAADHHKLLLAALEQFDEHFTTAGDSAATASSADLVTRMSSLVSSTTKLNSGLRGLSQQIREEQLAAELDEDQRGPPALAVTQFEKSVYALVRASDDQVRTLTEDLVAITRVDKERERLRRRESSGDVSTTRPVSRASAYRSSLGGDANGGSALHSPPKRSATSSPWEGASGGATVSHASARSPSLVKEVLRDPLSPALDDLRSSGASSTTSANRRHTLGYAATSRLPFPNDSPTPASGRRESSAHGRSPLAVEASAFDTPSRTTVASARRQSIATSSVSATEALSGLGLPLPHATGAGAARKSKTSDTTVRPSSPSAVRFPTTAEPAATTQVDATAATSNFSPTHAPPPAHSRTYSDRDQSRAMRALELGANLDENEPEYDPSDDNDGDVAPSPNPSLVPSLRTRNRDLPDLPADAVGDQAAYEAYYYQQQQQHFSNQQHFVPPPGSAAALHESPSGRKSRLRTVSGGLGAALKNALRGGEGKKGSLGSDGTGSPIRAMPPPVQAQGYYPSAGAPIAQPFPQPYPQQQQYYPQQNHQPQLGRVERPDSVGSSLEERRERRKEVEGILRRAGRG